MNVEAEIGGYKVHPAAQKFPPMDDDEFDALYADIVENGLIDPVVLCEYEGETVILDGRHRFTACLMIGSMEVNFVNYEGSTPVAYVISKNKHRRHLNISQLAMVAAELKEMYEAEAKERMSQGGKGGVENKKDNDNEELDEGQETFPDLKDDKKSKKNKGKRSEKGQSRDKAGAAMGVSGRTVSKAQKVIDGGCDELQQSVRKGVIDVTIGEKIAQLPIREQRQVIKKIYESPKKNPKAVFRKHIKDKLVQRLKDEPQPPPEGPFRVIVIDPPWPYEKRKEDGTQRGQTPYPTMSLDEIRDLVDMINGFAADDCILWLWTTNAHFADGSASSMLDVWEFDGKTVLTWEKDMMGTGDWLRGKTEHCILATRGKPVVDLSNETTIIRGKVREHSRKPEEFYELVNKLCPGSKVEVFATVEEREGWQLWKPGNWREVA